MKQVLLIYKDSPIRDLIQIYFSIQTEVNVTTKESISEAQNFIESNILVDLIFIGDQVILDSDVTTFVSKLNQYIKSKPTRVFGTNKGLAKANWVQYIHPGTSHEKILEELREVISTEEKNESDFISIPFYCFQYIKRAPCDLFLAIEKREKKFFVKRIALGDSVEKEILDGYEKKDVSCFSIKKEDKNALIQKIKHHLTSLAIESIQSQDKLVVVKDAFDYASFLLAKAGFKAEAQEIASELLTKITDSVSNLAGNNQKIFEDTIKKQGPLFFKHVSLTAIVASSMYIESKWKLDRGLETLAQASFFHNFMINTSDDEAVMVLDDISDVSSSVNKITSHAQQAAQLVEGLKGISPELCILILEHHGSKTGVGFPKLKYNSNKMSELFMIANEFAALFLKEYEKSSQKPNLSQILANLLKRYGESRKKTLDVLKKCVSNELL
jgi:hypothetical protein